MRSEAASTSLQLLSLLEACQRQQPNRFSSLYLRQSFLYVYYAFTFYPLLGFYSISPRRRPKEIWQEITWPCSKKAHFLIDFYWYEQKWFKMKPFHTVSWTLLILGKCSLLQKGKSFYISLKARTDWFMSSDKNGWIQCVGIKVLLTHFFVIKVGLTSFGRVYRTQNEMMICSSIHNFLTTLLQLLWKALLVGYMSTKKLSWLNKQLGHHLLCTFRLSLSSFVNVGRHLDEFT